MNHVRALLLCTECVEGWIINEYLQVGIRQTEENRSIDITLGWTETRILKLRVI
jgi:hypothetical protein